MFEINQIICKTLYISIILSLFFFYYKHVEDPKQVDLDMITKITSGNGG
jgi:hypothetical protein